LFTPTWGAANPTPFAWRMTATMSSTSGWIWGVIRPTARALRRKIPAFGLSTVMSSTTL
jgi:hypothetical protein